MDLTTKYYFKIVPNRIMNHLLKIIFQNGLSTLYQTVSGIRLHMDGPTLIIEKICFQKKGGEERHI